MKSMDTVEFLGRKGFCRTCLRCVVTVVALSIAVFSTGFTACDDEYEVKHLFTLDSNRAVVSWASRPNPTLAVNSSGEIVFPTKPYTIGIFSADGVLLREVMDSTNIYPLELLFDDQDVLQALAYNESVVIKYPDSSRIQLPFTSIEDWWKYSDVQITSYLANYVPEPYPVDKENCCYAFQRFPYLIEMVRLANRLYINGSELKVFDLTTETVIMTKLDRLSALVGLPGSTVVFDARGVLLSYVHDISDASECKIHLAKADVSDSLTMDFNGSGPETNKRNGGKNWYWARDTKFVYAVVQFPSGFRFYRITVNP